MTTTTEERLISADDHVDLTHDRVKAHLAPKFHDAYDAGIANYRATMTSTASIVANQRWREQEGLEPDPTVSMASNRTHGAAGRQGHRDPHERLQDMRSSCGRGNGVPSGRSDAIDAHNIPALRIEVSTDCAIPVRFRW